MNETNRNNEKAPKTITRREFVKGTSAGVLGLLLGHVVDRSGLGMALVRAAEEGSTEAAEVLAAAQEWIVDDGYGNLTANFPDEYPVSLLKIEDNETIIAKVDALMKTLTQDEKIDLVSADGATGTQTYGIERSYRTGYWKGCARVGVPIMAFYDGPMGIRMNAGYETTRPISENGIAATFDTDAAYEYGVIYGTENINTSSNNQLGSQIDLLYDLTRSRGKDMYGEDWYLAALISAAQTKAQQENFTSTTLKHFLNNGDVDEQTLHEMYLEIWKENIVKSGATAVMTGYEVTNGVSACEDTYLMKSVLRAMWGYEGLVMTDWGGNYSFTLDNGVTMETPSNTYNNAENINAALESGEITQEDLDTAVRYNLMAMGKTGYLGLVAISKDGTAAVDYDAPDAIEIPDITKGDERTNMLEENNTRAIETAQKGAVLVKNEENVLPLADEGSVAMIGLGAVYTVAGSHGENAFGYLKQLSISPTDALAENLPNADVQGYVAQDIVGEAVPADVLFVDAEATENGVTRTGHDGNGNEVDTVDEKIDFVTNSTTYFNEADGTAFEYGEQGAAYTMTTYLKAPSTGRYEIKVEGIFATTLSAEIEIDGNAAAIACGTGSAGTGFFATSGLVTNRTGLDIPTGELYEGPVEEDETETEDEMAKMFGKQDPTYSYFDLEEGTVYKITVTFDAALEEDRQYLAGTKDTQIRLAWITPEQKEENYSNAVAAAESADTSIVFLSTLQDLSYDEDQLQLLSDVSAAAKANGHKVVAVLTDGLLPDISSFVDDVDAVLHVWQPGQGGGTVIGNVLSGAYNPSGKLPITWPANYDDTSKLYQVEGRSVEANGPSDGTSVAHQEGLFIGYKYYDALDKNDSVLYDFGHGLSYTTFSYEVADVTEAAEGVDEIGFDVTIRVTNTGDVAGSAVPQIYLEGAQLENGLYTPDDVQANWHYTYENSEGTEDYLPQVDGVQQVKYQLVAFAHTPEIEPGGSAEVTVHINQRVFCYWDTAIDDDSMYERANGTKDKYVTISGERTLYLAEASDQLLESFNVTIK